MKWTWRTKTYKQVKEAIETSFSYRQVLRKLNLKDAGGNYDSIKRAVKDHNFDISHFKGKAWNKGMKMPSKRPLLDYLENKQTIQSYKLKKRLLKEGLFERRCSNCRRKTWMGNPIPIELDHINGNPKDNSLSNLRLLCPNCHALTSTYRGKNKNKNS